MRYELGQANRLGNRDANQDRFAVFEAPEAILLVLADGMGGHSGGETAAQMLVDKAGEAFAAEPLPVADAARFFKAIVEGTHRAIQDYAREQNLASLPGTTGVLCLVQAGVAQWAHVGDSRLYVFRNDLPLYRTRDHSYVEKLASRGAIRRSDKTYHPLRNQITQCIGGLAQTPEVEIGKPTMVADGDLILLCSDGLWGALEDMQIGSMLNAPDLDEAANRLAELAERNSYPHSDNISVLALRVIARDGQNVEDDELVKPRLRLTPRRAVRPEKIQDAIDQIEQVIKKYEEEMNR